MCVVHVNVFRRCCRSGIKCVTNRLHDAKANLEPERSIPRRRAAAIADHDRLIAWGDELRRIHTRLRDALAVARTAIEDAESDHESAARDLLLYCRGFCEALSGHHRSEDTALFPELLAAHPELAPVVSQLTTDHNMIEHLLNGLARAVSDGAGTDDQLRHLDGIEAVMETHFRYEEKRLIDVLNAAELGGTTRKYLGPLAE